MRPAVVNAPVTIPDASAGIELRDEIEQIREADRVQIKGGHSSQDINDRERRLQRLLEILSETRP